ncbi:MAG: hypothetical protein A2381_15265 [Bdellovibrionales bacterium RIFOXYB1_FULL_37_110]|nr:MAG: hypothetical protein A2381_15265 [Bdellovibrionales bacterium RIFOXYB1_FULL_37_110]
MQMVIIRVAYFSFYFEGLKVEGQKGYSVITVERSYLTPMLEMLNASDRVEYFYVSDGVGLFDQAALGYDRNAYPKWAY